MDEPPQRRKIKHRLAVLRHADEVTGNVAATCRYYGISRQVFYKRRRRYEADGLDGLRDRSHRPLAIVLIVLAATYAGTTWGLGRTWARLPFVNRNRWAL